MWLKSRNDSPIRVPPAQSVTASATFVRARSRFRSFSRRVTRVRRVPKTKDSVRTVDDAESAWMNRRSSRECRSIEPEMSHRTTSGRGRFTGRRQTHSRTSPPVPRLLPEHRPRRQPPAVPMMLVAPRPALLELRLEEVHEPLGVAELLRRHPVEVAMPDGLGPAVRVRGDRDHVRRRLVPLDVALGGNRHPVPVVGHVAALVTGHRRVRGRTFLVRHRVGPLLGPRRLEVRLERAPTPVAVEDAVVDRAIVASPGEDRGAGGADELAITDVDQPERPREVDLRADVHGQAGPSQLPPETHGAGQQPVAVDGLPRAALRRSPDRDSCPDQPPAATSER